jgi:hypothetical protein
MSDVPGKLEVVRIVDNEDGSANVEFSMDWDTITLFAKIGIMHVLTEAVEKEFKRNEAPTDEA